MLKSRWCRIDARCRTQRGWEAEAKVAAGLITCFVLVATGIIDKYRRREIGIGSSHEW